MAQKRPLSRTAFAPSDDGAHDGPARLPGFFVFGDIGRDQSGSSVFISPSAHILI
jgi:hypothetical protein